MKATDVCVLTNFLNLQGNQTIINVDVAAGLHNLGDVLVVEPQDFLITFVLVLVVKCELDGFTPLELNLSGATLNKTKEKELVHFQDESHFMQLFVQYPKNGLIGGLVIWQELTPLISPVLISGPLVSRAMATGLYSAVPGLKLSAASRIFLMVSAWYCNKDNNNL